jgi:hypothetical protein
VVAKRRCSEIWRNVMPIFGKNILPSNSKIMMRTWEAGFKGATNNTASATLLETTAQVTCLRPDCWWGYHAATLGMSHSNWTMIQYC